MPTVIDSDHWRSGSHRNLIQHLTGPFTAGAVESQLRIDRSGKVEVARTTREPLLLALLDVTLDSHGLKIQANLQLTAGSTVLLPLEFAPYTEVGASLLLYRPPVATETATAAPFTMMLSLSQVDHSGSENAIAPAEIAKYLQVHLVEGVLGRTIYMLGAEKQRIRRQAREIDAMRSLAFARDDALDRFGADLGVPRFSQTLIFKRPEADATPSIFGRFRFAERRFGPGSTGEIATEPRREPDAEYRQRLAIYRSFHMPNRQHVLHLLNGPGDDSEPNRGLISQLGFLHRFQLTETDNEFAISIHLVSAGNAAFRNNFLEHTRLVHLILPADNPTIDSIHNDRYLPTAKLNEINQLRSRLRQAFQFAPNAALAPMIAHALDRVGRCRRALNNMTPWQVHRTQESNGGSRYELGLGVDVQLLAAAELQQMAERLAQLADQLNDPDFLPTETAAPDEAERGRAREVKGLLKAMRPRLVAEDPEGRWLLMPCGIRTVHRVSEELLYLSNLPTFGMAITGPSDVAVDSPAGLQVRYHAPGDPGSNVVLVSGLASASAEWTATGGDAWTTLTDAEARSAWAQAVPVMAPVADVLRAALLPAFTAPDPVASVVESLERLSPELISTIRLATPFAQQILTAQPAATRALRRLANLLGQQGLTSVLPLVTSTNQVLLVIGVIGLPGAGLNLSERRATGFRWHVIPLYAPSLGSQEEAGKVQVTGSRTTFTPTVAGLFAVVATGYARRGLTDPYELQVELPQGALLNLLQYEFLMNLLHHAHPLGIEINTASIRQQNVDIDGNELAEPLPSVMSQSYRQFRRPRYRGEVGVDLEPS